MNLLAAFAQIFTLIFARLVASRMLLLSGFGAILLLSGQAQAQSESSAQPLVSARWLDAQLKAKAVVLVDASMPHQHAAGRIPGAVLASVFGQIGFDQSLAQVQRRIQAMGISPGQTVVVYDEGASWMAARLFHDLHIHGVPLGNLRLLDGGLHAWKAFGGEVAKGPSAAPATGTFVVTQRLSDTRAALADVFAASGNQKSFALIDALEPESYFGAAGLFDRLGHIPGAKNWPVADFFDPVTKRFKTRSEIERMANRIGIQPEQTAVVYCGGGGAAAVPNFALRYVLGKSEVKLYNESLREWLADSRELPIATYPDAQRLRTGAWLQGWNSPMLRMVGYAQMNLIDLRPKAEFDKDHIPHAINLPAVVFRDHLQQNPQRPEQLQAVLAAAGIQPAHRMLLISDAGLTPDAALAAALLERAGAAQVSLLTESTEDWAFAGRALANPSASPARAMPAASFAAGAGLRFMQLAQVKPGDVVVNFGKQAADSVAAASGQIHLPYTALLDAKGAVKPAKALWAALSKAGVPRYARLIATADDPGEAAVGYFVLKLMGFADVQPALLPAS